MFVDQQDSFSAITLHLASTAPFLASSIVAQFSAEEAVYTVEKDYLQAAIMHITTRCGINYDVIV